MPRPTRKTPDKSSEAEEVSWSRRRRKSAAGRGEPCKKNSMTIEAGMYMKTNKTMTTCPGKKAKLIRKRNDIFCKSTCFLLKSSGCLPFFEHLRTNLALQNIEARW